MSLHQQLQAYRQSFQEKTSTTVLEVLSRNTSLLQQQQLASKALKVGDRFPDFSLTDSEGTLCHLSDLIANGPTVVSFYRGGWCPYCVIELKALRELVGHFPSINATLVAISPEHSSHTASTKAHNELNFTVLSDVDNQLAHQCGLVFSMAEELKAQYAKFGIDISEYNKNDKFELPIPATYVLDQQGVICYAFVEEDYISRAEPDHIFTVLQALHNQQQNKQQNQQ